MTSFTIRPATATDEPRLRRLAALDSQALPHGELLVGVVAGEIQAAYDPASRRAVANPFVRTAELVEVLAVAEERPAARQTSIRAARGLALT